MINPEQILSKSLDFAEDLRNRLSTVKLIPSVHFQLNSSQFRDTETLEKGLSGLQFSKPVIYVIELVDGDKQALLENYRKYSGNKDIIKAKLSKDNESDSSILYVGSSTTNFKTRLENHLGLSSDGIYSLHLKKWDDGINYNIAIQIYDVASGSGKVLERFIVEVLEQQMWDELRPIFGKKSGLL